MQFFISRELEFDDGDAPCEGAYQEPYVRTDVRTVDDPRKIPLSHLPLPPDWESRDASWWYDEGSNHRVENGQIKRDYDEVGWFIDIEELDELLDLSEREGVLKVWWETDETHHIEMCFPD